MLDSVSDTIAQKFYELKLEHEALVEAISQFNKFRIDRKHKATLLTKKEQNLVELRKVQFEISQELVTTNIFKMKNNWFIIGQQKGKKRDFFLMGLKDEITKEEVEDVLQGKLVSNAGAKLKNLRDKRKYTNHRKEISERAKEILFSLCEDKKLETFQTTDGFLFVTEHAFLRWEERVLKNKKKSLSKELKLQREQEIRKVFSRSKKVYFQERTGRTYFLDDETMILFCVQDNTIISLWINEYGFSSEKINREITYMQLNYLKEIKGEIEKLKEQNNEKREKINKEKEEVLSTITSMEKELEELKRKTDALKHNIATSKNIINTKKMEEDKLKKDEQNKFNELKKEEAVLFSKFTADIGEDLEEKTKEAILASVGIAQSKKKIFDSVKIKTEKEIVEPLRGFLEELSIIETTNKDFRS